ncbi:YadA-like family protein [Stenotrophomonas sp.]|uniref:YadA-like family protein n=1 Tax=Stenotrophomonas sp. TaxID=69392 RepID=UPI0028AC3272|nr:YadA-like family protein [Stenotrophomonas sp.]
MNRIFRLVWSHRLNALVVVSEVATARGSLAAGPVVVHLKVPLSVLSIGLAFALGSGSALAAQNQTLTDLEALTNKYAPLPVQVDANVALATVLNTAQGGPQLASDAGAQIRPGTAAANVPAVHVNIATTPQSALPTQVALPSRLTGTLAGTGLEVQVAAQGTPVASAQVAVQTALPSMVPRLQATLETALPTAAAVVPAASVDVHVATTGTDANAHAVLDAAIAVGKEENTGDGVDDALRASVSVGAAGNAGLEGVAVQVEAADRNQKMVEADVSVQANALDTSRQGPLGGVLGGVGDLLGSVGSTLGTVGSTVGLLGDLGSGLGATVGNLGTVVDNVGTALGGTPGGPVSTALPPGSPKAPAVADPGAGLIIGTGGLTGSLSTLVGPTAQGLLGGDGYVRNGNLAVSSANVMQTYSVTNVLGVPLVNLTPVGTLLDGLGGATTGGSSHLTLIGGVTSDSYIYNINNGNPNGLLGLVLPDGSPAWSNSCLDVLGVVSIDCWAVNAAQDYQVLMGDGAYANGSREVVIGANARHQLPLVDANVAFPGAGENDPTDPTGVPTADYAARMGHSVVVGDSATGTANGQVLLGAEATSNQANSVALGYRSAATRGAQASYAAYGMTAAQVSAGEVSVGVAGSERQISHVAAGSAATDAVNVAQLQGAISQVNAADIFAVSYDDDGTGQPDYARVTLGNGGGPTTVSNLANGAVAAGSTDAVNGSQLSATNTAVANYFGGLTAFDPATGTWTAPSFQISTISTGGAVAQGVYDNASDAFAAVDGSLVNLNTQINNMSTGVSTRYLKVNSTGGDAAANGVDSIAVGEGATAVADDAIAVGAGAMAMRSRTVSVGALGSERQVVNVAAGTEATDAVNMAQLLDTNEALVTYLGGTTAYDAATGLWTAPTFNISAFTPTGAATTTAYGDVTGAFDAVNSSLNSLNTRITQAQPGSPSPFVQINSTKGAASATGADSIAIGPVASASGAGSTAIGDGADASADNSVALGSGAVASVGAQSGYTGAYGAAGASNSAGEVSVGSTGAERKVTHVADGSAQYDAVNVGQLQNGVTYAIDQSKAYTDTQINTINNGTSGMFQVNNSNGLAAPAASGANTVAGGAGASAAGANSTALGNGASATARNAVALGAGSVASRDNTVSVGSAGAERQITDVGDGTAATDAVNLRQLQASQQGTLRYDSTVNGATNFNSVTLGGTGSGPTTVHNVAAGTAGTDAVNVDQLRAGMNQSLDASKAYTDERMGGFDRDLRRTDNRASAGVAAAMAVAGLPQPYEAGRSMAAIAAGSYNGESGVAIGISGVSDGGRMIYKLSGSTNSRGEGGVSVGAGFQW